MLPGFSGLSGNTEDHAVSTDDLGQEHISYRARLLKI